MENQRRTKCSPDLCCCFIENGFSAKSAAIICMEAIIFCVAVAKRDSMSDTEIWLLSAILLILLIFQLTNISFLIAVSFLNYVTAQARGDGGADLFRKRQYLLVIAFRETFLLTSGIALIIFIDTSHHWALWTSAFNLGACACIAASFWKQTVYREEELDGRRHSILVTSDGSLQSASGDSAQISDLGSTCSSGPPPKYSVVNLEPPSYDDVIRAYRNVEREPGENVRLTLQDDREAGSNDEVV